MKVFAATGHRPNKLGGYAPKIAADLVKLATIFLNLRKPNKVISGMALGWDQAWAEAENKFSLAPPQQLAHDRFPHSLDR